MREQRWKKIASKKVFEDRWFKARADACQFPDGRIIDPYYVVELPNWANAIVVTPTVETEEFTISQGGGVLTHSSLMSLAKTHAKMPVTNEALQELIDTYYMVVEDLEAKIRKHAQLGGNPVQFIESINQMKTLMSLGWMRNMLSKAAHNARESGLKRIDLDQIVQIDPFQ